MPSVSACHPQYIRPFGRGGHCGKHCKNQKQSRPKSAGVPQGSQAGFVSAVGCKHLLVHCSIPFHVCKSAALTAEPMLSRTDVRMVCFLFLRLCGFFLLWMRIFRDFFAVEGWHQERMDMD